MADFHMRGNSQDSYPHKRDCRQRKTAVRERRLLEKDCRQRKTAVRKRLLSEKDCRQRETAVKDWVFGWFIRPHQPPRFEPRFSRISDDWAPLLVSHGNMCGGP
jgi:hypothetical protein